MKNTAAAFLWLLLMINLQQTRAVDDLMPLKQSDDLKDIKNILYEQGSELAQMKTQLKYLEKENADLKTKMTRQIKRYRQTDNHLENLNKEISAQLSEVSVIRTTLVNNEVTMGRLMKDNEAIKKKVSYSEDYLDTLKKEITDKIKVAFSAGLSASIGPLSGLGVVVYSRVITNTGAAYSPSTGVFTAPTTGIYYFRFTACGSTSGQYSGVSLYRNQERLTHLFEYNNDGYPRHFSGGITVYLSEGDNVTVRLPSGYRLYEDSYTRNIFSGFLLFPMDS